MGKLREYDAIKRIVIHCSDTPNGRADTIEDIDRWHGERNPPFKRNMSINPSWQPQLKHIGYHYVIETDGAIRVGRPLCETGAHVAGHNDDTIGICMVGRDAYSFDQWVALQRLIADLNEEFQKYFPVIGHRDLQPEKPCPGFDTSILVDGIPNEKVLEYQE